MAEIVRVTSRRAVEPQYSSAGGGRSQDTNDTMVAPNQMGAVLTFTRPESPRPEPLSDQRCQRAVGCQQGLALSIALRSAVFPWRTQIAEALHGDAGLDDLELRPSRTNHAVTGASFMKRRKPVTHRQINRVPSRFSS